MDEVIIFTTCDEPLADMAIGLLEAEGISAQKRSGIPRSVLPVSVNGLGKIEIFVSEEDAEKASDIISARFSEGDLPSEDI